MPGDDPRPRARCGTPTTSSRTRRRSSPTRATPRCTTRPSTSAASTAPFDPTTMGTVPNVGLMAQKAEEYGSHDKTFEIAAAGTVRVVDRRRRRPPCSSTRSRRATSGACARPRTPPVRTGSSWPSPAPARPGWPAVFWLDGSRAHDAEVLAKVDAELADHDTDGLDIEIMAVDEATRFTPRTRQGRRGHHLGHRQRAARLPDRPVPDPRGRHQREDALHRAADGRRRAVRDRRRRLGARSTSSSS